MKLNKILTAVAFAVAASASFADMGGGALDLTTGSTFFGRSNAIDHFTDTYTFTLAGMSFLTAGTASTSAVYAPGAPPKDLDFTRIVITNAAAPGVTVATFAGNLGDDANEFYALTQTLLPAGNYDLVVTGVNSPSPASYSGTLTVAAIPEPETYALMLAGLGAMGFIARRRKNNNNA